MKKKMIVGIILGLIIVVGGGIFAGYEAHGSNLSGDGVSPVINKNQLEKTTNYKFTYDVNPETFEIITDYNGVKEVASKPLQPMKVTDLKKTSDSTSWVYPDKNIKVNITKEGTYLNIQITSTTREANSFEFPNVSSPNYTLPIGEGKYIPNNNKEWEQYLNNYQDTTLEMFSMPFFALNKKDYSIMYIMTNPYNNNITFNTKNNITFNINHDFPTINPNKTYGFRIYVTPNNPVDIAKTYKDYVVNKGDFKTLAQKAAENPNVNKLIGAPQVYLWNNRVIEPDNINWKKFNKNLNPTLKKWMISLLQKQGGEQEQIQAIEQLGTTDFVDKYDRNLITSALTTLCMSKDFYNKDVFTNSNSQISNLLSKGINNLDEVQTIELNKLLLKSELGDIVDPVNKWADSSTTSLIKEIHNSGIKKMWIGLNNWTQAYLKPSMVTEAVNDGYLMAPYDSYTSIQKPGDVQWDTAGFPNTSLYDDATMKNKDGQYRTGFKGQGRLLNPTLAMPSVKERVATVMKNIPNFNSWFIDCDAAGQVFNDYSKNHTTTKAENVKARMERLSYVANDKHMVVGSEGGCDYASEYIDFAEGLECQPFSWMDKAQMKNKTSPYYVGSYYSPTGGVPPIFGKQIPVKKVYKTALMDPAFTIPLYKMVYNNSVITTYEWLWGNFKVQGEVKNRMLHDILYNVPALYHLDQDTWQKEKNVIIKNNKVWEPFSDLVSNEEMTNFKVLSPDRLVQMTQYGNNVKVISNFSNNIVTAEGYTLKPQSLVIVEGTKHIYYSPSNLN